MLLASLVFSIVAILVKELRTIPVMEIIFFRSLTSVVLSFSHIKLKDFRTHLLTKKKTDNIQVTDILSQEYEYESFQKLCYLMD